MIVSCDEFTNEAIINKMLELLITIYDNESEAKTLENVVVKMINSNSFEERCFVGKYIIIAVKRKETIANVIRDKIVTMIEIRKGCMN